ESTPLTRFDGSWYVQPLPGNPGFVYVRYFLIGNMDTSLPDWIVESVMRDQLTNGVREMVRIFAKRSPASAFGNPNAWWQFVKDHFKGSSNSPANSLVNSLESSFE